MYSLVGEKFNNVSFFQSDDDVYGRVRGNGVDACYKVSDVRFTPKAEAVMMDLDGTTLDSEPFWIYMIQLTMRELMGNHKFDFEDSDIPYISGYTTIEHLRYCIDKYCPEKNINDANQIYHKTAAFELGEIMNGRGNINAFVPKEGLADLLNFFKKEKIKIGLVTSGLDYKAIPEIVSVFKQIGLGDPLDYYDAIITGGKRKGCGDYGSLGEIVAKPHPWLYTELAYAGLHIEHPERTIVIEDSSAGVMGARFAGFSVIGLNTGNITESGLDCLCQYKADNLSMIKKIVI